MSPPEWHAQAKRLRAAGLTYREISEHLMRPLSTVQAAVAGENARRRAAKQAWARAHYRGICERCGDPTGKRHRHRLCWSCDLERRAEPVHARAERIVAWWAEGLSLIQIAARLGWSVGHLGGEIHRLRAKGYNLPYHSKRVSPQAERIVAWWAEGLTQAEIGERLGWSTKHVGTKVYRLRAKGYDLPYRRRPGSP